MRRRPSVRVMPLTASRARARVCGPDEKPTAQPDARMSAHRMIDMCKTSTIHNIQWRESCPHLNKQRRKSCPSLNKTKLS